VSPTFWYLKWEHARWNGERLGIDEIEGFDAKVIFLEATGHFATIFQDCSVINLLGDRIAGREQLTLEQLGSEYLIKISFH
jgi:hypothetical protein